MKKYNEDDYIYDLLDIMDKDELFTPNMEKINVYKHNIKSDKIKYRVKNQIKENTFEKRSRFTRFKKSFIACAILLLAIIGVFTGAGISNANKFKNTETNNSYGYELSGDALDKYSTDVNKKASSNGIDIMISSVLVDNKEMWIKHYISSQKFDFSKDNWFDEFQDTLDFKLSINNKEAIYKGGSFQSIDNNTLECIQTVDITGIDFKDTANVSFSKDAIGSYTGKWKIDFDIKIQDIALETKEYKVGKTFILGDSIYRIQSVVIYPLKTTVYYKSFGKSSERMELKVLNEKGIELQQIGGESSGRFFMAKGSWEFSSLNISENELTIIPERLIKNENWEVVKTLKGKEIKVNLK